MIVQTAADLECDKCDKCTAESFDECEKRRKALRDLDEARKG